MFRSTSLFDRFETVLLLGLEGGRFETVNLPIFFCVHVLVLIPSNDSTAHNLICMSFVIIYI